MGGAICRGTDDDIHLGVPIDSSDWQVVAACQLTHQAGILSAVQHWDLPRQGCQDESVCSGVASESMPGIGVLAATVLAGIVRHDWLLQVQRSVRVLHSSSSGPFLES